MYLKSFSNVGRYRISIQWFGEGNQIKKNKIIKKGLEIEEIFYNCLFIILFKTDKPNLC